MKIKVVHLITGLNTGGAEMMLYKLLKNMDGSKFENIVITMMDKGTIGPLIEELGIRVYELNMKRGVPSLGTIQRVQKIIDAEKPDILQTWMYHADLLGLIVWKLTKDIKLIWNIRCSNIDLSDFSFLTRLTIKLLKSFSKYPDAVIVNSNCGKDVHVNIGYKPRRWQIIYNGFELDKFIPFSASQVGVVKETLGINPNDKVVGIVARYDKMKGYDTLISAADIILRKHGYKNLTFVLIGRDVTMENQELKEMLKGSYLENYVLLGERKDINNILPIFDLYISASRYGEGFSNSIGEAMACGVPCIVTDVGDSAAIIGDTGKAIAPNNPSVLVEAILEFLGKTSEELELIRGSVRQRVCDAFDIKKIAKDYELLYCSLEENK